MRKINWGIIGYGNAAKSFIKAASQVQNVNIYGISSITNFKNLIEKKKEKNFQNIQIYNDHINLLSDTKVDAIYVALTNDLHFKWIMNSLNFNKNVLTEKPACTSSVDFEKCNNLSKKKKIILTEAIMYRHHPQTLKIVDIIKSGLMGKVKSIKNFCGFDIGKKILGIEIKKLNYNSRLLNKNLGGGAILDLGCYPLSMSILIAGINNPRIQIEKVISKKKKIGKSNVDEVATIELSFTNKIYSYSQVAIRKKLDDLVLIEGTKGHLKVTNPWLPDKNFSLELSLLNERTEIFNYKCEKEAFVYLIENVSSTILFKKKLEYPIISPEETMLYLQIIDKWNLNL
jgi:predicted dehydrogenase